MYSSDGASEFANECNTGKQDKFVCLLKGKSILFSKSQIPEIKIKKQKLLEELVAEYEMSFGQIITAKQIMKKINNIKTEVKKKTDLKATGNKKVVLKQWEKDFLELLDAEHNPVFSKIACILCDFSNNSYVFLKLNSFSGGMSVGIADSPVVIRPSTSKRSYEVDQLSSSLAPQKKLRRTQLPETEETQALSTPELQRLVLLEQLQLIRTQQKRET